MDKDVVLCSVFFSSEDFLVMSLFPQVRSKAQQAFFTALGTYNFCCRDIIPLVLEFLRPDRQDVTQKQFKVLSH